MNYILSGWWQKGLKEDKIKKMDILEVFGISSGVLMFISAIPYTRDIILGNAKPERASWFIWTVLGSIAFFSQLAKGATSSLWLPGIDTFAVLSIFILSIKYGKGGLGSRDIKALVVALLGIVIWAFTKEAIFALIIVIVVDSAGAFLTFIKTYEDPASETMSIWVMSGISGLLAALSVGSFNWVLLMYPLYIIIANWTVPVIMVIAKKNSKKS